MLLPPWVRFVMPISSSALLIASFPPISSGALAWIALVSLALVMVQRHVGWQGYLGVLFGGAVFHLGGLDWMRTLDGYRGFSSPLANAWWAAGGVLTIVWLLGFWLCRRGALRTRWPLTYWLPIGWLVFEYVRRELGWAISETPFPWLQLGSTQVEARRLLQTTDVAGTWALTALVAMVNGLVADVLLAMAKEAPLVALHRLHKPALVCGTLLVAAFLYGEWRLSQNIRHNGPVVCLMPRTLPPDENLIRASTATPHGDARDVLALYGASSIHDQAFPPWIGCDLLLWPEAARITASEELAERWERVSRAIGAALAIGCLRHDEFNGQRLTYNSAALIDPFHGVRFYDKVFRVPWSEFAPITLANFGRECDYDLARGIAFPSFRIRSKRMDCEMTLAATICFESCFPELHRGFMAYNPESPPPDFFVTMSREDCDPTMVLQATMLTQTRLRAVESRRPIVRNVEHGWSCLVDGNGQIAWLANNPELEKPVVLSPLPLDDRISLYMRVGDWLPLLACAIMATTVVIPWRR